MAAATAATVCQAAIINSPYPKKGARNAIRREHNLLATPAATQLACKWRIERALCEPIRYSDKCLIRRVINVINHAGRKQNENQSSRGQEVAGGTVWIDRAPLSNLRQSTVVRNKPEIMIFYSITNSHTSTRTYFLRGSFGSVYIPNESLQIVFNRLAGVHWATVAIAHWLLSACEKYRC